MEKKKVLNIDRQDRPHACCHEAVNMELAQRSPTLFVETCQACQRRHYVMFPNPVPMGVTMNRAPQAAAEE